MLAAIKEYEASKWKVIGQKVGKPAKVGKDGVVTTPLFLLQCAQVFFIPFSAPVDETGRVADSEAAREVL